MDLTDLRETEDSFLDILDCLLGIPEVDTSEGLLDTLEMVEIFFSPCTGQWVSSLGTKMKELQIKRNEEGGVDLVARS